MFEMPQSLYLIALRLINPKKFEVVKIMDVPLVCKNIFGSRSGLDRQSILSNPEINHELFLKVLKSQSFFKWDEVPHLSKNKLSDSQGVYFCVRQVSNQLEIMYVGKANNFRQRWRNHHKNEALEILGNFSILCLQMLDYTEYDLLLAEKFYINLLKPVLNGKMAVYINNFGSEAVEAVEAVKAVEAVNSTSVSKLATFRINSGDWQYFQDKAKANGSDASTLLRGFIADYLLKDIADHVNDRLIPLVAEIEARIEKLESTQNMRHL